MKRLKWFKTVLAIFLILLINKSVFSESSFIILENGISYFDINNDGVKDVAIVGEYTTTFGGNIFKAYSFYLKEGSRGLLSYVPIYSDKSWGSAVIYTYSKVGGCGSKFNKKEITNISGLRIIKIGNETYLVYLNKKCKQSQNLINGKCEFGADIYKYDDEDRAFVKYKMGIISPHCDAEEVFKFKMSEILSFIKGEW